MALTKDPSGTASLILGVQNDITHSDSPVAQALGVAGMIPKTSRLAKPRGQCRSLMPSSARHGRLLRAAELPLSGSHSKSRVGLGRPQHHSRRHPWTR